MWKLKALSTSRGLLCDYEPLDGPSFQALVDALHTASLIHNLSTVRLWRYDTLHSLPAQGSSQLNVNVYRNAIDIFLSSRRVEAGSSYAAYAVCMLCSYALVDIAISQMSPCIHWRSFFSAFAEQPWQSSCRAPIFCRKSAHWVSNLRSLWVTHGSL